jgi:predicted dehydrogenase
MASAMDRRNFLKNSAVAAALAGSAARVVRGANDKIQIGWIGVGTRGYAAIEWLKKAAGDTVAIPAICDTFEGYRARAKDRVQTIWGNTPAAYDDYHDLLADRSIDAVFIMTPEHLHHEMAIDAMRAGKHVYVEKPLAHTIEEGFEIVREWKKSGKIVQVGTQNRSSSLYKKAKEMVQQGMIGDVHFVRAFWYRNSTDDKPAWRYAIPPDATEQNTDWLKFLGPAPRRPWDAQRYFQWRLYWDYSGGISTDLLVHQTDIVHYMLDRTAPLTCVASGGIYRWTAPDDDRDVPDTFSAIYEYPDKLQINYSCYFGNDNYGYGEQLCGNEGTLEIMNRKDLYFTPQLLHGKAPARVQARQPVHLNGPEDFGEQDGAINHFRNWLEAIRGHEPVIAPPEIGQQAAVSGHLATLSFKHNQKILWDQADGKYQFA